LLTLFCFHLVEIQGGKHKGKKGILGRLMGGKHKRFEAHGIENLIPSRKYLVRLGRDKLVRAHGSALTCKCLDETWHMQLV
jgi:hypothetical protein